MNSNPRTDSEIQSLFGTGKDKSFEPGIATQVHLCGANSLGTHIDSIITIS
jgi:hypothetical protein